MQSVRRTSRRHGGPLQIACFFVGTDTSSGAKRATMVPESKKMDMPYVVAGTAKHVRDFGYSQHTENQRHESRPVDIRFFDVREANVHNDPRVRSSCVTWMMWLETGPEEHLMSDFEHMM